MTARERFLATFRYGKPDKVFLMSAVDLQRDRQRWLREGQPWDPAFQHLLRVRPHGVRPVDTSVWPPLESKVVEQTAEWRIEEDELGGQTKSWSDRELGMSQHLRYPVRDRETWEKLKARLKYDAPNRYPEYWEDFKRCQRKRDYPLGIFAGSYYGWIRNWVGWKTWRSGTTTVRPGPRHDGVCCRISVSSDSARTPRDTGY